MLDRSSWRLRKLIADGAKKPFNLSLRRAVPDRRVAQDAADALADLGDFLRIGCLLCHAPVRDGAAKGKVERFFRTVRESFLTRTLDLSSVDALNRDFTRWVEDEYNAREHGSLGMKPIDRFGLDLGRIRFLPPSEANDELFFVEQDRTVMADNTFSLKGARYEAPRDLRSRKVQIRFDRSASGSGGRLFQGRAPGRSAPRRLRRQ